MKPFAAFHLHSKEGSVKTLDLDIYFLPERSQKFTPEELPLNNIFLALARLGEARLRKVPRLG